MKIFRIWLFISLSLILPNNLKGQDFIVSDPSWDVRESGLYIYYDILQGKPDQEYNVWLIVTDAEDRALKIHGLSGDVGSKVTGGKDLCIVWDYAADGVDLNSGIFISVEAEPVKFSRAGLLVQSAVFPGLGLSRYKGGPHWLKGVAAYSCVAGSIILNRMAVDTYGQINESTDLDEKETLYEKSIRQDNISEGLAYGAIAIWAADLIWTLLGTSDLNEKRINSAFRIDSAIDPLSGAPLLVLNYRF